MSFERFWNHDLDQSMAMHAFTWQHGLLIILGVLSVILTLRYAKKIHNCRCEKRIKRGFAFWLFFLEIIYHLHYWTYGMFSVPLHLCSFGVMLSITILLTDNKKVFEILFFIGIFGGLLALFIPNSLGYTYYNMRYYHYAVLHMSIAIVPIYYFKAYGYRVTKMSVYKTTVFILLLTPFVTFVNTIKDKNYMFIGEKPLVLASILPRWPYYILIFIILGFGLFNALYYLSNADFTKIKTILRKRRA